MVAGTSTSPSADHDREVVGRRVLHYGERDRPELVVVRRGRDPTDDGGVVGRLHDLAASRGQSLARAAVQVQPHQSTRRPTEIRDPRHCLLAAVTALVQLDRRPDPAQLVRDRAVVGLESEPRPPGGNPKSLKSEGAGRRAIALDRGRERQKISAGHENLPPGDLVNLGIDPAQQGGVGLEDRLPHDGPVGRHVLDLDPQQ